MSCKAWVEVHSRQDLLVLEDPFAVRIQGLKPHLRSCMCNYSKLLPPENGQKRSLNLAVIMSLAQGHVQYLVSGLVHLQVPYTMNATTAQFALHFCIFHCNHTGKRREMCTSRNSLYRTAWWLKSQVNCTVCNTG